MASAGQELQQGGAPPQGAEGQEQAPKQQGGMMGMGGLAQQAAEMVGLEEGQKVDIFGKGPITVVEMLDRPKYCPPKFDTWGITSYRVLLWKEGEMEEEKDIRVKNPLNEEKKKAPMPPTGQCGQAYRRMVWGGNTQEDPAELVMNEESSCLMRLCLQH